jgi:hypothetical protein
MQMVAPSNVGIIHHGALLAALQGRKRDTEGRFCDNGARVVVARDRIPRSPTGSPGWCWSAAVKAYGLNVFERTGGAGRFPLQPTEIACADPRELLERSSCYRITQSSSGQIRALTLVTPNTG